MLVRTALDVQVPDLLGALLDALYTLPPVRFVLGLASPAWRPLWALTWLVALVYLAMRIVESAQRAALHRRMAREVALPAPIVTRPPDLVPATLAAPTESPAGARPAEPPEPVVPPLPSASPLPPTPAARPVGIWPSWPPGLATRTALLTALLGAVLLAIARSRPDDSATSPADSLSGGAGVELPDDRVPDPSFTFAARSWRPVSGGCLATLEVTGGSQPARTLTMYVMDASGAILGKDVITVPSLTTGAFHEFRFPGVDCGAIVHWQVQG